MKRSTWIAVVILVAAAALLVFWQTRGGSDGRRPATVRVGYLPYSTALPLFVAIENGQFQEAGLSVEPVKCASSNEAINALRAGEVDVVVGVGLSTFFAVEGAAPGSFKCFQPCAEDENHSVSYVLVPKGSTLTDVSELRGKKVGTYSGTSQVLVLKLLVRRLGLDPGDPSSVRLGDVASSFQMDALAAGQFDAFLMLEPYATTAILKHGARPLITSPRVKYILDPFPAGANAVRTQFLKEHPQLVEELVSVFDAAIRTIHSDEAAATALLPKYDPSIDPEVATKAGIYHWYQKSETNIDAVQEYADLLYGGQAIKHEVTAATMFLK